MPKSGVIAGLRVFPADPLRFLSCDFFALRKQAGRNHMKRTFLVRSNPMDQKSELVEVSGAEWYAITQKSNELPDEQKRYFITLISPHYLTSAFPKLLEKNGLRRIRFHDLRHSCASLLLANGVPMKQIQEWLGHSDFSTTANVYAHLDYNSKLSSADAMVNGLRGALSAIN